MKENRSHQSLIEKATAARKNAYAPYSHFAVGAAILGKTGKIFTGCNVENSSYGLTICAERAALFHGIAGGEKSFEAMAVVTDTENPVPPCGACLQVLAEFNPHLIMILVTVGGEKEAKSLEELFPLPFGKNDML
jgi:cytidine deaminase